jgi:hypothetical protein
MPQMADSEVDSKSIKAGFSAPVDVITRARKKAGSNFSAYITGLIEKDLKNVQPELLSSTVIVDMARLLVGELDARKLARQIGDADQPEMLQKWLRQLLEKPEEPADPTVKKVCGI